MYKVTLSMPVYNVAPYVERALLSALNQTFKSIEFLIVDDRGTDNSMEIVRRIIKEHPRGKDVRIIEHPHNIGTGATKNTAIDNAQGEFLFFMDSDDEITLDCIQILYDKMMEHPVDLVVSSRNRVRINGNIIPDYNYDDVIFDNNKDILDFHFNRILCRNNIHIETWNKLYNLSFLRKSNIRCVANQLNEDNMFTTKLLFAINSCALISNVTYYYYEISNSTTGSIVRGYSKRIAEQYIEISNFHKGNLKKIEGESIFEGYHKWFVCYLSTRISGYFKGDFSELEKRRYINDLIDDIPFCLGSLFCGKCFLKYIFILSPYFIKKLVYVLNKK